jgi:hypothetical protein
MTNQHSTIKGMAAGELVKLIAYLRGQIEGGELTDAERYEAATLLEAAETELRNRPLGNRWN